ncbi:hypothetical protein Q1695_012394 [Nippostrongylus brasiliensis]|nr:hypothetical protein Q1695_012394 [Nippostrongylus brasiliensis]
MIRSYYIVTASISALGVASNFLLMYLSIRCSSSKADYKYFVFFSAFQDLIFAAGFTLISPMASTRNFTFVFANTGPAGVWPYGMIIMVFFCITTITSVLFVANNFLYRYLSLCKTRLFQMLVSKEFLAVAILINTVFVANWMCMIYFSLWPYDGFIKISQELWSKNEVDIENRTYIAISNRDGTDPLKMGILIESLALLMFIAQISPACAMQIHRTLKQNSFSETTKKLHRQTLVLLSIQTVCPTVFMHLPLTLMYILLFTGANSPVVMSYIIGTLMASNPLFAPIITIAYPSHIEYGETDDSILRKRRGSAVPQSDDNTEDIYVPSFINSRK